jgi:hypothetical protein
MFRKTKQYISFGLFGFGILLMLIGIIIITVMDVKNNNTIAHDITYSFETQSTPPDQFSKPTPKAVSDFRLRDASISTLMYYNDFSITSPPVWKLNYNDSDADIKDMVTKNMDKTFSFSNFVFWYHDSTLNLLCSSPDGYSRLSNVLIGESEGTMTIVPKPMDLSIVYLPQRNIQANVTKVGRAIALSHDNQRLYVSYYPTDNIEGRVYHKDQTSSNFPSTPLLNLKHKLCGAISIFHWNDINLEWTLQTTIQHPFGSRIEINGQFDHFGKFITPWTMRNYVTQQDTYMFTTFSIGHSNLHYFITYQEDGTLYNYFSTYLLNVSQLIVDESWLFIASESNEVYTYSWNHNLKTCTEVQRILSISNPPICYWNKILYIYPKVYEVDNGKWTENTQKKLTTSDSRTIKQLVTDPLHQIVVAVGATFYIIFPISIITPTPLIREGLLQEPKVVQVQFVSQTSFVIIMSTESAFYCDVYKTSE